MGVMDKFLNIMRLNDDTDYDDDNYYDEEEEIEESPARERGFKKSSSKIKEMPAYDDEEQPVAPKKVVHSKVTPINRQPVTRRTVNSSSMEVCVIKPTSVEDAHEITETLLTERTVVLNLEGLDVDMAQRIIDFTSGSCFAIKGNLQRISHYIFIITPASVDVSGDFQNILGGNFERPLDSELY